MEISKYEPAYDALLVRTDVMELDEREWLRIFSEKCVQKVGHLHITSAKLGDVLWLCFGDVVLEDVDLGLELSHFIGTVEDRITRPKPRKHRDGTEVRIREHKNSDDIEI